MPIDSTCSGCGRVLRVEDECAGTEAQCPICKTTYAVPEIASPANIDSLPDTNYYVRIPTGAEFGPASRDIISKWIRERRVNAACLMREDGKTEWIPFLEWNQASENATELPTVSHAQRTGKTDSDSLFGEVPIAKSIAIQYPHSSKGTFVLALGIVSWVLCITWVATIPVAIAALIVGFQELSRIARGETSPRERPRAVVGMWLAGLALSANILLLAIMIFAAWN